MYYFLLISLLLSVSLFGNEEPDDQYIEHTTYIRSSSKVDLVVFSFDRPLQLYALLESCERYFTGLSSLQVIYKCSNDSYKNAYNEVKLRFPSVLFHLQSPVKSDGDFKPLLLKAIYGKHAKARYIMFAVDDMIVTDFVDLCECVEIMRKNRPWFFSLRLGKNIQLDTVLNMPSPPPRRKKVNARCFSWRFSAGLGAWNYPNSTDLTIYRKKDLRYFFKKARYTNPNTLEGSWILHGSKRKTGIAFNYSKAVNIPLNVVNPYWTSSNMNIGTAELLDHFNNGEKIDISDLHKLRPYATHVPHFLSYIKRSTPDPQCGVALTKP